MKTISAHTSHLFSRSGLEFEPLEPRQLLTAYLGQSPAEYFHAPLDSVTSANDALTFVYANSTTGEGAAVVNGSFLHYSQIPGLLAGDEILGVNDAQMIIGRAGSTGDLFEVNGGVRSVLTGHLTVVGAPAGVTPDYAAMVVSGVAEDGTVVLKHRNAANPIELRSYDWLLRGTTLTYLWWGNITDVSPSGTILGVRTDPQTSAQTTVVRAPDGTESVVSVPDFSATCLGPNDEIVGIWWDPETSVSSLAAIRGGVPVAITLLPPLPAPNSGPPFDTVSSNWDALALDASGNALVALERTNGTASLYGLTQSGGLHDLDLRTFGAYSYSWTDRSLWTDQRTIRIGPEGILFLGSSILTPMPEAGLLSTPSDAGLGSAAADAAGVVFTTSSSGEGVVFTRGAGWTWQRLVGTAYEFQHGAALQVRQWLAFTDPSDGLEKAVLTTPNGTYLVQRANIGTAEEKWWADQIDVSGWGSRIIDHASLFTDSTGRVHVAGTGADGHLLLFYKSSQFTNPWLGSDLTTDHIQAAGKTFVPVAGNTTSFTTPWGGMNIAYLDAAGDVQVVWWAPGLTLWTIDDLSTNAGAAPALHGTLVSYVTPWGGMNVAGTDASGNLVALWWAPGMATWRADRLVEGTPAQLDENTLTAYVTPWGGLNIAGLDKSTGKLTAYWWVPGRPTWTVEEFTISGAPADLSLTGRLSSAVSPGGDVFIAAVTADHHLANIWFGAANNYLWTFEDVTMAV